MSSLRPLWLLPRFTPLCVRPVSLPLRRAFWFVMLVAHAPALFGAWRALVAGGLGAERLGGCVVLTLSMMFFVLKVRDVAFLPWRTDRRSCIAFCVIVALLHTNAILPDGNPTVIPECTTLVVTTGLTARWTLTRRVLAVLPTRVATGLRRRDRAAPSTGTVWLDAFRPHCFALSLRVFSLRAPPA